MNIVNSYMPRTVILIFIFLLSENAFSLQWLTQDIELPKHQLLIPDSYLIDSNNNPHLFTITGDSIRHLYKQQNQWVSEELMPGRFTFTGNIRVAMDNIGNIHVLARTNTNPDRVHMVYQNGSWQTKTFPTGMFSGGSKIVNNDDAFSLVTAAGSELVYYRYLNSTWNPQSIPWPLTFTSKSMLKANINSSQQLVFYYLDNISFTINRATRVANDWNVEPILTIDMLTRTNLVNVINNIEVSSENTEVICHPDQKPGDLQVGLYCYEESNGNWNEIFSDTATVPPANANYAPQLKTDANGTVHLAYLHGDAQNTVRYLVRASGIWSSTDSPGTSQIYDSYSSLDFAITPSSQISLFAAAKTIESKTHFSDLAIFLPQLTDWPVEKIETVLSNFGFIHNSRVLNVNAATHIVSLGNTYLLHTAINNEAGAAHTIVDSLNTAFTNASDRKVFINSGPNGLRMMYEDDNLYILRQTNGQWLSETLPYGADFGEFRYYEHQHGVDNLIFTTGLPGPYGRTVILASNRTGQWSENPGLYMNYNPPPGFLLNKNNDLKGFDLNYSVDGKTSLFFEFDFSANLINYIDDSAATLDFSTSLPRSNTTIVDVKMDNEKYYVLFYTASTYYLNVYTVNPSDSKQYTIGTAIDSAKMSVYNGQAIISYMGKYDDTLYLAYYENCNYVSDTITTFPASHTLVQANVHLNEGNFATIVYGSSNPQTFLSSLSVATSQLGTPVTDCQVTDPAPNPDPSPDPSPDPGSETTDPAPGDGGSGGIHFGWLMLMLFLLPIRFATINRCFLAKSGSIRQ